jgi:hypothetical protein
MTSVICRARFNQRDAQDYLFLVALPVLAPPSKEAKRTPSPGPPVNLPTASWRAFFVARNVCLTRNTSMKTNKSQRANLWRIFSRRATPPHDPWLVFNLKLFNLAAGWSQLLAREQAEQFGR